jgi:hypothetical protein
VLDRSKSVSRSALNSTRVSTTQSGSAALVGEISGESTISREWSIERERNASGLIVRLLCDLNYMRTGGAVIIADHWRLRSGFQLIHQSLVFVGATSEVIRYLNIVKMGSHFALRFITRFNQSQVSCPSPIEHLAHLLLVTDPPSFVPVPLHKRFSAGYRSDPKWTYTPRRVG